MSTIRPISTPVSLPLRAGSPAPVEAGPREGFQESVAPASLMKLTVFPASTPGEASPGAFPSGWFQAGEKASSSVVIAMIGSEADIYHANLGEMRGGIDFTQHPPAAWPTSRPGVGYAHSGGEGRNPAFIPRKTGTPI